MSQSLQQGINAEDINKQSQLQSLVEASHVDAPQQHSRGRSCNNRVRTELLNIGLLMRKNITLTIKNPKNLLFLLVAPFILSALLFMFQKLADDVATRSWIDNPQSPVGTLPKCFGENCTSLVWMTVVSNQTKDRSPEWINHTVEYIRRNSDLGDTIRQYPEIVNQQDWQQFRHSLEEMPNKTQIGLVFCLDSSQMGYQFLCESDDQVKSYYLLLNKTDSFGTIFQSPKLPVPTDIRALELKVLVDNGILDFERGRNFQPPMLNYRTQQYPVLPTRFLTGFDMITQAGAFYYMITPLFAFLFIQNEIVREKQFKLRQGLNVFGASHFSYWLSWFVISLLYSLIVSAATLASGIAFGFPFFTDTPFLIIITFMFSLCLAMQMLSYFIATVVPNLKAANSISYGFVLFAIVVQSFLADVNLLQLIFETNPSGLVVFLKSFLSLYPPFSYSKIFSTITQFSGNHFSMKDNKWEKGPGFSWDIFNREITGKTMTKGDFVEYSSRNSVIILALDIVFYAVLTWYFDHVVESNRGRGDSPIFFLKKSFWVGNPKQRKERLPNIDDLRNPQYNIRGEQESVINERLRVFRNYNSNQPVGGMRIKSLSKTFKGGICSKTTVLALRNISIEIEKNELMSILGHNGAGKTTLINILTGILSPDYNRDLDITINNESIHNIDEVRRYIGVCPQFDILWKEMSAAEHLRLFARLKGISSEEVEQKIDSILEFVSLLKQKHSKVGSFSGGMKRRLSLAIAAVGNPKIIFLDEPTTGLDPKVRQQVWTLIEKLKKNKSIVLTTHSMQEADFLSDRISILVKGRLKCLGSSMYLKDSYGSGYRIALNVQQNKAPEVMRYMRKLVPDATEIDSNGGNLLVGISNYDNLIQLVKMLESKESSGLDEYSLKQNIKDWNVSHTTLEEVFMKVTKETDEEEEH